MFELKSGVAMAAPAAPMPPPLERTGAFSHHLDMRPVCEMWVGLTCAKFSIAHLQNMERSQIESFSKPTSHFRVEFGKTATVRHCRHSFE